MCKLNELLKIVDDIEEFPGDIPDVIYNRVHMGAKEDVVEILRAVVTVTKNEIRHKIITMIMKGEDKHV